jgi:hypothetical protein
MILNSSDNITKEEPKTYYKKVIRTETFYT